MKYRRERTYMLHLIANNQSSLFPDEKTMFKDPSIIVPRSLRSERFKAIQMQWCLAWRKMHYFTRSLFDVMIWFTLSAHQGHGKKCSRLIYYFLIRVDFFICLNATFELIQIIQLVNSFEIIICWKTFQRSVNINSEMHSLFQKKQL